MKRILSAGLSASLSIRCFTPSDGLKKLYGSDFDKGEFPLNIVPGDSVLFAKFLFKAAEPKGNYDTILKDFQAIAAASAKLPIFWERTAIIEQIPEFKNLSEPTFFTLVWMQNNGMLDLIAEVAEVFEAYVNAKQKKAVARIYVAPGPAGEAALAQAKGIASKLHQSAKELAGNTLSFKLVVDRSIVEGFAVELAGHYENHAVGHQREEAAAEIDYTNIPPPTVSKTVWEDNIETEILRKYLDSLAQFDAEEAKQGV